MFTDYRPGPDDGRYRARVAKERLQLILAHERGGGSRAVSISPDDIRVHLQTQDNLDVLDVKIELPDAVR